jgi:hypothetical protein
MVHPLKRLARAAYHASPASIVKVSRRAAGSLLGPGHLAAANEVTESFVRSPQYRELMSRHLPCDGSYDLHEAQNETRNYLARHHANRAQLGVFRWRGIEKHLDFILSKVGQPGAQVIDFGGAACPLGLGSKVVDHLERDANGQPVECHSLEEVSAPVDVIFTSHTLEHIEPLDDVLALIASKLKPGGYLLAHVPSYTCDRWLPGVHSNKAYHDHVWCFGLRSSQPPAGLTGYTCIDDRIARHLTVEVAEFCGDDSIFVIARRDERTG